MAGAATVSIEVHGVKSLTRVLKALAEDDAPFLRKALEEAGALLEREIESRAPGSMPATVTFRGVTGSAPRLRASIRVKHPGAKSMEFGRSWYYRDFMGRAQKATGQRFRASPGQRPKPFIGIIKGDAAVGAVRPRLEQIINEAIEAEWHRLGAGED